MTVRSDTHAEPRGVLFGPLGTAMIVWVTKEKDRSMVSIIGILVGLVLLLSGRRLYWLFVAGIGFLTGLALAPRLLPGEPDWMILAAALLLALVGAVLAVVAQRFIVALIGVLAGGGIGVLLLRTLGLEGDVLTWIVYVGAGVAGLVLALALFEWGLILLSSLAGAIMIVVGVQHFTTLSPGIALLVVVALALMGIVGQARGLGEPPRRARPAPRA